MKKFGKKKLLQIVIVIAIAALLVALLVALDKGLEPKNICLIIFGIFGLGVSAVAYLKNKANIGNLAGIFSFLVVIFQIPWNENSPVEDNKIQRYWPLYIRVDSIWNDYEARNKDDIESLKQDVKNDFLKSCLRELEFSIELVKQGSEYYGNREKKIDKKNLFDMMIKQNDKLKKNTERLKRRDEIYQRVLFVEMPNIYSECNKIYNNASLNNAPLERFLTGRQRKALDDKIKLINDNTNALSVLNSKYQTDSWSLHDNIKYQMERDELYMKLHDGCTDFVRTLGKILDEMSKQK